jgi:hypothetical protein
MISAKGRKALIVADVTGREIEDAGASPCGGFSAAPRFSAPA